MPVTEARVLRGRLTARGVAAYAPRFTASLGYATEAALVRAFKRERGETLGAHRAGARGTPRVELAVSAG